MKQVVNNPLQKPSILSQVDPTWTEKDVLAFCLDKALHAQSNEDRHEAALALGARFGDKAVTELVTYLQGEAKDAEPQRIRAVVALGAVSQYSEDADRALAELALADSSEKIRRSASLSIASSEIALQIVSGAMSVVYPLERRMNAVRALGVCGERGLSGLRLALADKDVKVQGLAVEELGRIALLCLDAERHLKRASELPDPKVSEAAKQWLQVLGHRRIGDCSED
jgi:HEAT repeat protein